MKNPSLCLLLALVVSVSGAYAADLATPTEITAVTVYPDRALVTRAGEVKLPAGETTLVFSDLPAALQDGSVQFSGQGAGAVTILDVNTKPNYLDSTPGGRIKTLEDQLETLQGEQRVLDQRGERLTQQRALAQRLTDAATTPNDEGKLLGLEDWAGVLKFQAETFAQLDTQVLALDAERKPLAAKIAAVQAELNDLLRRSRNRLMVKTISVRLTTPQATTFAPELRYTLHGASWTPSYDARLDAASRKLDLTYYGLVQNATGEDWKRVALTLSTARPNLGGSAPEVQPWVIDVWQPRMEDQVVLSPFQVSAARDQGYTGSTSFGGALQSKAAAPRARAQVATATIDTAQTSATFRIAAPASVPSDNTTQKVTITTASLDAKLTYATSPKLAETAFLSAKVSNTTAFPWLGGTLNAFLDGNFVTTSTLKSVMPSEELDLALGADEGITIKHELVKKFTEQTGFTSKGRRVTYDYLIKITNNKLTPEYIVAAEPAPVSRNEKITIKQLVPADRDIGTPENLKEVSRKPDGTLEWRVMVQPGATRELALKFAVEYPADLEISGLE